jgi:hypothetical protein
MDSLEENKYNYENIIQFSLIVDDKSFKERGYETIIDKNICMALRENRIALAKREVHKIPSPIGTNLNYYDISLICIIHSHPECSFRWARLMIDFGLTKDTRILDMSPQEVKGENPIEQTTIIGGNLKYEIIPKILLSEVKAEIEKKHITYYPEIVSSGIGFTKCYWDFIAKGDDYLHSNRELRLLISSPSELPLRIRFNLRAKAKLAGIAGIIPLIAKEGEIDQIYSIS